ncbi:M50 family metallopeptidase [Achromobacter xylosoxidans]|uniref:M50 family metallopeptidase n=1 Tax=Alcaligenes xylosoxydans xylosoxydans TaxID=85698 RepID=UPI000FD70DF8|nr:M50 family metallopeptidase [Achromobacter xylosoxidans]
MKSDKIKNAVCFHEAGHWVVARHFGFKTGEIRITITKDKSFFGHHGSSKIFPRLRSSSKELIEKYLRNRISVLFAGVIAQSLTIENKKENSASDLLHSDGSDDHKTVYELLYILRGVCHPDEDEDLDGTRLLKLQKECWESSDQIVQKEKIGIATLAHKMAGEISRMNYEYIFDRDKLAGWLPNLPPNTDTPPTAECPLAS